MTDCSWFLNVMDSKDAMDTAVVQQRSAALLGGRCAGLKTYLHCGVFCSGWVRLQSVQSTVVFTFLVSLFIPPSDTHIVRMIDL